MRVKRYQEALGTSAADYLHPIGSLLVEQETHLLANQSGRCLIQSAVDGDGTVLVDSAAHLFAEVVVQVGRWPADQFQVGGETLQGGLGSGGVGALMVVPVDPVGEHLVQLLQSLAGEVREDLTAHGTEEAFDLAASLRSIGRGVGKGVGKGDAQTGHRPFPGGGSGRRRRCPRYVPVLVMCPNCADPLFQWWSPKLGGHDFHRFSSQFRRAWSSLHTGFLWDTSETDNGGSHACNAYPFARISTILTT